MPADDHDTRQPENYTGRQWQMHGLGPTTRWERQRMRVRRTQIDSPKDDEDYAPPPTGEILTAAAAEREKHATQSLGELEAPMRLSLLPPRTPGTALAAERDLYLRIFSGNSKASRRKAARDWRHLVRDRRAMATRHTSSPSTAADIPRGQEEAQMTPSERDAAYDKLTGPAAALYRQLGVCPVHWFDGDILAVLTELDVEAGLRLAETLVDAGLMDAVNGGYAFSADGHLHARFKAEECEDQEGEANSAGVDRLFTFLTDAAAAAERLITPSHRPLWGHEAPIEPVVEPPFPLEEAAALDWLELRLGVFMDAVRFAFADKRYAFACELPHRLWPLWLRRRHPEQRIEALTIGFAAATVLQNDNAIGQMLTTLAGAVRSTDPAAAADYNRRAALHYQQVDDTMGLAQAINGLGKAALSAGQLDQANQHFCDAEQLRSGLGYIRGVALSRQGRGLVALARGDTESAADLLLSAHQMLLGCGDGYDAALTLVHHAEALARMGDHDSALMELETARTALVQATSVYGQAATYATKARILTDDGRVAEAEAARRKAAELRAVTGEPRL